MKKDLTNARVPLPSIPDKDTQIRLSDECILRKLGYEWSNDYQMWASQINYSLAPLSDRQGHALAKCVNAYALLKH